MKNRIAVGKAITALRIAAGYPTIAAAALAIGVSASNLGNIEVGRHISGEDYLTQVLRGLGAAPTTMEATLATAGYVVVAMLPTAPAPTAAAPDIYVAPPASSGFTEDDYASLASPAIRALTRTIARLNADYTAAVATTAPLGDLPDRLARLVAERERRALAYC